MEKKQYLKNTTPCKSCKSVNGPCNLWKPEISSDNTISVTGHCQDCGYSFTRTYTVKLIETVERK